MKGQSLEEEKWRSEGKTKVLYNAKQSTEDMRHQFLGGLRGVSYEGAGRERPCRA